MFDRTSNLAKGLAKTGMRIAGWTIVLTWLFDRPQKQKAIDPVLLKVLENKPLTPQEEQKIEREATAFYKRHGMKCPECGKYVPKGIRCRYCEKIVDKTIRKEFAKIAEMRAKENQTETTPETEIKEITQNQCTTNNNTKSNQELPKILNTRRTIE